MRTPRSESRNGSVCSAFRVPRSAFTMIELMVVIGIIALLITIAVPAFNSVIKQSKRTHTAATINSMNIGIEAYKAETGPTGGSYPPSYNPVTSAGGVPNPHERPAAGSRGGASQIEVFGANLVAWALVGADLLGTPGFRNVDGAPDDMFNYGGWTGDTGNFYDNPNPSQSSLYALYPSGPDAGKPVHPRSGPYVELSKMELPRRDDSGANIAFVIDKLDKKPTMNSICFLDSFHQPILYYKANTGASQMASDGFVAGNVAMPPVGRYVLQDNLLFTGSGVPSSPGMDFGAGTDHRVQMSNLGTWNPSLPPGTANQPPKGSFAHLVWNPDVTATWRPYRDDSFLLLSAGADGLYGTADDVANADLFAAK